MTDGDACSKRAMFFFFVKIGGVCMDNLVNGPINKVDRDLFDKLLRIEAKQKKRL